MEMQPTPHILPRSPEATAALQRFKAYAMSHTLLAEVDKQISRAIHEPAGFSFVLLYGPSGVGKTTLIRQLELNLTRFWRVTEEKCPSESEPLSRKHPATGTNFRKLPFANTCLSCCKSQDSTGLSHFW